MSQYKAKCLDFVWKFAVQQQNAIYQWILILESVFISWNSKSVERRADWEREKKGERDDARTDTAIQ